MEWSTFIERGFDYDRWANHLWIDRIGGFKNIGRAHAILEHILSAQRIWLKRIGVEFQPQQEDISLRDLFDVTSQAWVDVFKAIAPEETITYVTMRGDQFSNTLEQIAIHVINHGTYHRGQLRGLAESEGFENFPETDFILYLREWPQ